MDLVIGYHSHIIGIMVLVIMFFGISFWYFVNLKGLERVDSQKAKEANQAILFSIFQSFFVFFFLVIVYMFLMTAFFYKGSTVQVWIGMVVSYVTLTLMYLRIYEAKKE